MRIINIVVTLDNNVESIDSFGIFEEQLSQEVVDQAEKFFIKKAKTLTLMGDEDVESFIEDGFFEADNGYAVSIVWSDI